MRDGSYLKNLESAIRNTKVIFSATGNMALSTSDFRKIRDGAYLISVTSSDEFDLSFVEEEYQKRQITDHIVKYSNEHNYFYLVNEGSAVNFLFNAALDKFIHLVQATMLVGIADLLAKERKPRFNEASGMKYEHDIAHVWIKEFTN